MRLRRDVRRERDSLGIDIFFTFSFIPHSWPCRTPRHRGSSHDMNVYYRAALRSTSSHAHSSHTAQTRQDTGHAVHVTSVCFMRFASSRPSSAASHTPTPESRPTRSEPNGDDATPDAKTNHQPRHHRASDPPPPPSTRETEGVKDERSVTCQPTAPPGAEAATST